MEENVRRVGGEQVGYLFEFKKDDGVYLTVYPAGDDAGFELSDMRQILQDHGAVDYDIATLSRVVREAAGKPVRIAGDFTELSEEYYEKKASGEDFAEELPPSLDDQYARIIVDISKDRLQAKIRFDMTKGTKLPTEEMVLEALREKKVTFGVDSEAIKKGIESAFPFVAANGIPPAHGENAYIERRFDLEIKNRPAVNEYDRVDYKNMNLFVLARKNDVLAVRIQQTKGTPGTNVFGDSIPARDGRPTPVPAGKNTKIIGEDELVATIDGQIVDTGSRISVDPQLLLKNGVNVGTGNIDFNGSVEIKGNVEPGFVVKATGDIIISGMVSGSIVEGRNVFIGGGITGMNRAKIRAEEDIRAAFSETADLQAGRDIYIHDVALHSQMRAGKRIVIEGKKGQLTGGITAAGEEVRAVSIGNTATVVTRVMVGIDPNLQNKYKDAKKRLTDNKRRLEQVTKTLDTLGKIDISRLPEERIQQINVLTRSQFPLAGQIKNDEKLIQELEESLSQMKMGKIAVADIIYPGVRVAVNSVRRNFNSEVRRCVLKLTEEGEIEIAPY